MSESFHRDMAVGYRLWASSYAATSTSKAKAGLLALAQAHDDEAARLTPPAPAPTPAPAPPPDGGGLSATVPSLVYARRVKSTAGVQGDAELITEQLDGSDSRREFRNVQFDVGGWFGIVTSLQDRYLFVNCTFDGSRADRATRSPIGAVIPQGSFIDCEFRGLDNFARVGGGSLLAGCWGHSPIASPGSHVDGVEVSTGIGIRFVNCWLEIPTNADTGSPAQTGATAAVNIAPDFGPIGDVDIDSCVLLGGGMPLLIRQQGNKGTLSNIRVRNTILDGGRWGPVNTDQVAKQAIVEWTNVTTLAGALIPKP